MKTRFQDLNIERFGRDWRFVATEDGAVVGPIYQSKPEILADLERYGREFTGETKQTNTNTQHTPTPWQRTAYGIWKESNQGNFKVADCIPDDGYGAYKCPSELQAVANADFIVRAVNSHDALLEALKVAKNLLDEQAIDDRYHAEHTMIEQAIAKAEGKS